MILLSEIHQHCVENNLIAIIRGGKLAGYRSAANE